MGRGLGGGAGRRGWLGSAGRSTQVEYFNNATIVDLVERPHRGILAVLDDACSAAGTITDRIFLQTLDTHHRHHPHYASRQVPLPPALPHQCTPSLPRRWQAPTGAMPPVLGALIEA